MQAKNYNPHSQFYVLLASMPGADKEELVWEYSHKLTTSLAEFYKTKPAQYKKMISDMQRTISQSAKPDDRTKLIIDRELKRRRSAILLRIQKLGVDTTNWNAVNKFMRNPRIAGKTLGEMDTEEMDLLIPKLESILKKDQADVTKKLVKSTFSAN